ncbi:fungal-specific transcription factor domain-containing protein [Dichomitus squalens]|nr:fungal-specific transcription factor domain-containing protein [Dichomitus squalens]
MNTSFERAPAHYAPMPPPEQQHYSQNWQPAIPELGPHDPAMNRGPMLPNVNDMLYHPPAPAPPQPQPPSMIQSPSIVSAPSSWPPHYTGSASSYHPLASAGASSMSGLSQSISTPTYMPMNGMNGGGVPTAGPSSSSSIYYNPPVSSLSRAYNINPSNLSDDEQEALRSPDAMAPAAPMNAVGLVLPTDQHSLINHYLQYVLPIQYLLADSSIKNFMFRILQSSPVARDAACLLSALHIHYMRYPAPTDSNVVTAIFDRVQGNLLSSRRQYNEGDAMAGLHIVSSVLFSGGRGGWEVWLDIASQYVTTILNDPDVYGPEEALRRCSESTRFIIKTTMWFDVLASVTTQQVPRFLEYYRLLFNGAYIDDPMGGGGAPEISMLPVMGCENKIVLAIAEISNLAHWKESQSRRGCLSIPELVHRGTMIEEQLLAPASPHNPLVPLQAGMYGPQAQHSHMYPNGVGGSGGGGGGGGEADVVWRRRLTNNIFRASAKVYLHTVLSGDYPACPEIQNAVTETIGALHDVPDQPSVHRSVVRSVVFGICLSGCLTDDRGQRAFLLNMLKRQQQESMGNITEVARLMQQVWDRRDRDRGRGQFTSVDWRAVMRESHNDLLLLV